MFDFERKFSQLNHELQNCGALINLAVIELGVIIGLLVVLVLVVYFCLRNILRSLNLRQLTD